MPKKLINDYIFYKIVCLDDSCELCYVGSTANWKERHRDHKSNCTNENSTKYNTKVYKTIRENGGWDNFKMIEIGTREQLTFRQAEQIEEEYRIQLKANLNTYKCYLTKQQKYAQKYEVIICECGCMITKGYLTKHKKTKKHNDLIKFICLSSTQL